MAHHSPRTIGELPDTRIATVIRPSPTEAAYDRLTRRVPTNPMAPPRPTISRGLPIPRRRPSVKNRLTSTKARIAAVLVLAIATLGAGAGSLALLTDTANL